MTSRDAARKIDEILDREVPSDREALVRAKQALEILATIEEKIGDRKLILSEDFAILARGSFRDGYTFIGSFHGDDLVDALGQVTTILSLEE